MRLERGQGAKEPAAAAAEEPPQRWPLFLGQHVRGAGSLLEITCTARAAASQAGWADGDMLWAFGPKLADTRAAAGRLK